MDRERESLVTDEIGGPCPELKDLAREGRWKETDIYWVITSPRHHVRYFT